MSGFLCIGARLVTFYANDAKGNTSVFLAIFQGDASSKRDTFSIRILATRLLPFMVNRNFDLFFPFRKKGLLVGSPCYLSLEKVHTMAFTIVAHAGQHQQLSCRCELHSKAGQRDASFSSIHETPRRNNNDAQPSAQKCIIANAHNG